MKATGFALCVVTALAGSAYGAQSIANFNLDQPRTFDVRTGQWVSQATIGDRAFPTIYSNIATAGAQGVQHSSAGEIVADDVTPVNVEVNPGSAGTVHEVTISIANFGASIVNGTLGLDIVFLRNDGSGIGGQAVAGTQFGSASLSLANFNLNSATFGLFTFSGLQSIPNPIQVSATTFWVGVRFSSLLGGVATDLGQAFYGPVTEGSSDGLKFFRDSTPSNPQTQAGTSNNFALQILVPTPGATAILGLGGLVALRRRRS